MLFGMTRIRQMTRCRSNISAKFTSPIMEKSKFYIFTEVLIMKNSMAEFYGQKCKEIAVVSSIYSLILWTMFILALIKKSKKYGLVAGVMFVIANITGFVYMDEIRKRPEDYIKGIIGEVFED